MSRDLKRRRTTLIDSGLFDDNRLENRWHRSRRDGVASASPQAWGGASEWRPIALCNVSPPTVT
jgi:hypothetical protein